MEVDVCMLVFLNVLEKQIIQLPSSINKIIKGNKAHFIMNILALPHVNPLEQNTKFPRIDNSHPKSLKMQLKSTTKLPILKIDSQHNSIQSSGQKDSLKDFNTEILRPQTKARESRVRQKSEGDDFVTEVEKKLKIVLEEQNIVDIQESDGSNDDFEQKINRNKEIIKMRKQQHENQQEQLAHAQIQKELQLDITSFGRKKKETISNHKKSGMMLKQKSKNDSLYEKRIRDYREISIENKFLMKKKENVQKEALFHFKKDNTSPNKDEPTVNTPDNSAINLSNFKSIRNTQKRKVEPDRSTKVITPVNSVVKDEELFDNIHSILMNPGRKQNGEAKGNRQKKQEIESKIRELDLKISSQKEEDKQLLEKIRAQSITQVSLAMHENPESQEDEGVWRKIEVKNLNLKSEKSNFDTEVERVNRYLQRNEKCIEQYLENQKLLTNITLLKKGLPKETP